MIIMNDLRIARSRGQLADQLSGLPSQLRAAEVLVGCSQLHASCCRNSAVCMEYPGPQPGRVLTFGADIFSESAVSGGAQAQVQGGAGWGGGN